MSAILNIKAFLGQRLKAAGKRRTQASLRAETALLHNDVAKALDSIIDKTIEEDFGERYHGLINLSPRRVSHHNHIDLLETVGVGNAALILTQPHKNDDVVWNWGSPITEWRDYMVPYPVDAGSLVVPPRQRHFRVTRQDVRVLDRIAVTVPDACVRNLVRFMKNHRGAVMAVVAAEEGVCVIFRTNATDYDGWQHWRRVVEKELYEAGVAFSPITLKTLVPISRESRGRGALLHLA